MFIFYFVEGLFCLFNSVCNSLNKGNSSGFIFSLRNVGVDCSGLSFIFHRYCQTWLINDGLFCTDSLNGHE